MAANRFIKHFLKNTTDLGATKQLNKKKNIYTNSCEKQNSGENTMNTITGETWGPTNTVSTHSRDTQ